MESTLLFLKVVNVDSHPQVADQGNDYAVILDWHRWAELWSGGKDGHGDQHYFTCRLQEWHLFTLHRGESFFRNQRHAISQYRRIGD